MHTVPTSPFPKSGALLGKPFSHSGPANLAAGTWF